MPLHSCKGIQRRKRKARRRVLRARLSPLLDLPVEVILLVFEHLPDLKSLSSIAETCRAMHNVFRRHSEVVITRILSKTCGGVWSSPNPYADVCQITADLEFAVHRQLLPQPHVEDAFAVAWRLFATMELEEILYPVARELAWGYYLDGRTQDAIRFLKAIHHHQKPYILPPCRNKSPAVLPVAELLHHFLDDANDTAQCELVAKEIKHLGELKNRYTTFLWLTNLTSEQSRNCVFTLFFPPQPPFVLHSEPLMHV
ncbi:hypothetical protein CEP53_003866 [Fusarium sp. AF-6]|nr:hypothetical protein CEP53_003866 [Fusarium sp. AF-6]